MSRSDSRGERDQAKDAPELGRMVLSQGRSGGATSASDEAKEEQSDLVPIYGRVPSLDLCPLLVPNASSPPFSSAPVTWCSCEIAVIASAQQSGK